MKRSASFALLLLALGACAETGTTRGVRLPDAPPPGEPSGTTGLSEASLKGLYGQPAFVRHDGTAQIWRFDGAACKAFFFLYSKDGRTAVWHVETAPRGASIAADETCLSALRARGASRPVS
ncbi:MAG TPA: hypothetical protein VGC36_01145 [Rhizomicrobium sp.]